MPSEVVTLFIHNSGILDSFVIHLWARGSGSLSFTDLAAVINSVNWPQKAAARMRH